MRVLIILFLVVISIIGWSCSENVEPIPSVSHPKEWIIEGSNQFHGTKVKSSGLSSCKSCHGVDYNGGESNVSCYSSKCHAIDHGNSSWGVDTASVKFHGVYLKNIDWTVIECSACHGSDYQGGSSGVSCFTCHENYPHPENWSEEDSDGFHGEYLENVNGDISSCQSCHGDDLNGGRTEISCFSCHDSYPHDDDWLNISAQGFHGNYIRNDDWSMQSCKNCHGSDYAGGNTMVSCKTCHVSSVGPEACNTCHGNFANESPVNNWAPPEDLNKNINTSFIGVGAHQEHLMISTLTSTYTLDCTICHRSLTGFDDPNHIVPDAQIELVFNDIATDSGRVTPIWNRTNTTCSDVYCHGNFAFYKADSENDWAYADSLITGNNPIMNWIQVGTGQSECGTCHGLPPTGHVPISTCSSCHGSVVDSDNNIIDKTKHINQMIDLN